MVKESKFTQSICFEFEDLKFLVEMQSQYHRKNLSQTIHTLIYYYKILCEQQQTLQKRDKDPSKKPYNPLVNQ